MALAPVRSTPKGVTVPAEFSTIRPDTKIFRNDLGTAGVDLFSGKTRDSHTLYLNPRNASGELTKVPKKQTEFRDWNELNGTRDFTEARAFKAELQVSGKHVSAFIEANGHENVDVPLRISNGAGQSETVMITPGKHYELELGFSVLTAVWDPDQNVIGAVG